MAGSAGGYLKQGVYVDAGGTTHNKMLNTFGAAMGVAGAIFMGLLTFVCLVSPRARDFPLQLLGEYFAGYTVTWGGVIVGMLWGFVVAFVAGWFVAFCRNLALAIIAFAIRTRAELEQTKNFLDHI